jgi:hypothetical protein
MVKTGYWRRGSFQPAILLGKKRCWRSPGAAKRCRHVRYANSIAVRPFANRPTMLLAKIALCP